MLNSSPKKNKKVKSKTDHFVLVLGFIFGIQIFFMLLSGNFFSYISEKISQVATVVSSTLAIQTNEYRISNAGKELIVSDLLTQAAQLKANDMAEKGYFSHRGPQGEEPWYWLSRVGYKYDYAGENLAVDFTESADVTAGWINSATHRANLLNSNFTEIGVATADGMFEGHPTTFVVQFFGTPFDETKLAVLLEEQAKNTKTETTVNTTPIAKVEEEIEKVNTDLYTEVSNVILLDDIAPEESISVSADTPEGQVLGSELSGYIQGHKVVFDTKLFLAVISAVAVLILISMALFFSFRKKEK